ncbi:MAG: recombination regulator RecX [Anaerolinea sp.]|nr:recombination regulator RecX [Anaerolinea sp.]
MGVRRRASYGERRARCAAVGDPAVVLEAALRFLEARRRSVAEVRRRLTDAGYREELVTTAIERLAELGILDDDAFAAQWVESRDRARPRGERALRVELRQKGVDPETIARALGQRDTPEGGGAEGAVSADEVAAQRLLARHAGGLRRIADLRARRQRAYATLARHGFAPEVCGSVVAAWLADATGRTQEAGGTQE